VAAPPSNAFKPRTTADGDDLLEPTNTRSDSPAAQHNSSAPCCLLHPPTQPHPPGRPTGQSFQRRRGWGSSTAGSCSRVSTVWVGGWCLRAGACGVCWAGAMPCFELVLACGLRTFFLGSFAAQRAQDCPGRSSVHQTSANSGRTLVCVRA
jgi:hypothetical protein